MFGDESPIIGSHPSLIEKIMIRSIARKNAGIDVIVSEIASVRLSVMEYCLIADKIPIGRPMITATQMLKVARLKV